MMSGRQLNVKSQRSGKLAYYLLSAPALLLSLTIIFIPFLLTLFTAFTDWNGISPSLDWVGTRNFQEIANDRIFWLAVKNNIKWTLLFTTIPVAVGLLAAVLLFTLKRGRSVYQMIYLIPFVLAPVTNAILWLNVIFSPTSGLIGYLKKMGFDVSVPLGNTSTALLAVAGVDMWHYWGFLTVIYLAALRQTPGEQIEAGIIEGASRFQVFWHIYLPNIKPTLQLMFVIIIIYSFLTFDYIYLITWGGPAHSTEMLSTYAYTFAFQMFQMGKAAAVALVMGLFGAVAAFLYIWLSRKDIME
jgi:raffinose/stachyose/melibiose transport system permease protein